MTRISFFRRRRRSKRAIRHWPSIVCAHLYVRITGAGNLRETIFSLLLKRSSTLSYLRRQHEFIILKGGQTPLIPLLFNHVPTTGSTRFYNPNVYPSTFRAVCPPSPHARDEYTRKCGPSRTIVLCTRRAVVPYCFCVGRSRVYAFKYVHNIFNSRHHTTRLNKPPS